MPLMFTRRCSCGSHAHGRPLFSQDQLERLLSRVFFFCRSFGCQIPLSFSLRSGERLCSILIPFLLSESCLATKPDLRSSIHHSHLPRAARLVATASADLVSVRDASTSAPLGCVSTRQCTCVGCRLSNFARHRCCPSLNQPPQAGPPPNSTTAPSRNHRRQPTQRRRRWRKPHEAEDPLSTAIACLSCENCVASASSAPPSRRSALSDPSPWSQDELIELWRNALVLGSDLTRGLGRWWCFSIVAVGCPHQTAPRPVNISTCNLKHQKHNDDRPFPSL